MAWATQGQPAVGAPRIGRVTSKVTFAGTLNSEWIKLRSLRSALLSLSAAAGTVIALGLLLSGVKSGSISTEEIGLTPGPDPVATSLGGVNLGQLVIGVLGVIIVTAEYSTGTIRSTLVAVPRRLPVLAGKAVVFGVATVAAMLVATFAAFLGGQALVGAAGASLGQAGVLRAVIGAAGYLTGVGLLGLAAGAILRGTAAAIGVLFAGMYAVPALFPLLPHSFSGTVGPYLPSNAGMALMSTARTAGSLAPLTGLAVFAGYILAMFAIAAILLRRRDA
jgi:ABC-type transport system involved in multi-copper enzyme maturation permease subunit